MLMVFVWMSCAGAGQAAPPQIVVQPDDQTVHAGSNVTFRVEVAGAGPWQFQWRRDDVPLSGAVTNALELPGVELSDAALYSVIVSGTEGSATSRAARLSVLSPPTFALQPRSQTLAEWGSGTLNAVAGGAPAPTLQWYKGGVAISGATLGSFSIPFVQPFHAGEWTVVASNTVGTVTSAVATVSVQRRAESGGRTLVGWGYRSFIVPCGFGGSVSNLAAGGSHSLAVRTDGVLIAWGNNIDGQSAVPSTLSNAIATAGGQQFSLGLGTDGRVVAWGRNSFGELNVPIGLSNVTSIAAGWYHALAVQADGQLSTWGNNSLGQATVPESATNVVMAAGGRDHSLALRRDGIVVAWGDNSSGQSAVPPDLSGVIGIAAGESHSAALRTNGTVAVWGQGVFGQTNLPSGATNIIRLVSGTYHLLALRANGTVIAWGDNTYRQSSVPENLDRVVAIAAGGFHSLALRDDGTVVAWGGVNRTGEATVPSALENVVAVAVGNEDTLILRNDGTVLSFGFGFVQQQPVPLGLGGVKAVSAGIYHNLALLNAGTVTAWGSVGGKTNVPAGLDQVVAAVGGAEHSVALRVDGTVVPWGDNSLGQTNLPVGLGSVLSIASGQHHTMALRNDSTVAEWGWTFPGRTSVPAGLTDVVGLSGGDSHSLALRGDGTVVAWGGGTDGVTNVPPGLSNIVQVAAGGRHNLALSRDGVVLAWGSAVQGPTNVPPGLSNVVAVAAGPGRSVALVGTGRPVILRQPADLQVSSGAAAAFSVQVIGDAPLFLQWLRNGQPLAGATNASLALSSAFTADAGNYSLVASNSSGVTTSASALLTVAEPPQIVAQPQDSTVFAGASVTMSAAVSGTAPIRYQWFKNGEILFRSTNAAHVIPAALLSQAGGYSVVAANSAGSVTSRVAALVVVGIPVITSQPQSVDAVRGSNAVFNVVADGAAPFAYQWFKEGAVLANVTNAVFELTGVQTNDAGAYHVVVSNGQGAVTSVVAVLTVGVPPTVTLQPIGQAVRLGRSVVLVAAADGTATLSYRWRKDGVILSDATTNVLGIASVQESDAGGYALVISNAYGTATSAPAVLSIARVLTVVGGTAPTGNSLEAPVVLQTLGNEAVVAFSLEYDPAKLEFATVSLGGGAAGGNLTLVTNEIGRVGLTVTSAPETSFARGTQEIARVRFVLGPTAGTNTIAVTNSPTALSLLTTNALSVPAEYEGGLLIATSVAPVITVQPQSRTNAPGTNAVLTVEVSGSRPMTFQWYAGQSGDLANPIPEATNASFSTAVLVTTTSYWVAVSNAAGATISETATVTIENTDPVGLTWTPAPIVYGAGLSAEQLNATARLPGSFAYSPALGAILPVGTHPLSVVFTPTNSSFASTNASVLLTVTPAPLTIQVLDQTNVVCAPVPVLQVRYAGLVAGDTPASIDLPLSVSTIATNCSPAGDYPIVCAVPANWGNYAVTTQPGTLRQLTNSISGLSLEPLLPSVNVGEVRLLKLLGTNIDGTVVDLTRAARWQSSDSAVLDLRAAGFAVGLQAGTAVAQADYDGQTSSVSVAVQSVPGRRVWFNPSTSLVASQAGSCGCLDSYQSTIEIADADGVVRDVSAILLDLTGPISAQLDHVSGLVATSVPLLERNRATDRSPYRWGQLAPPVSLALRESATLMLQRRIAPAAGVYRPDSDLISGRNLTAARGPLVNGTWSLRGFSQVPASRPGGWILVIDADTNTPPTIAPIADVTVADNSEGFEIPLNVADAETPLSRLRISVEFNRAGLVSGQAYWLGRTSRGMPVLHLRPERFRSGTVHTTVTVSDDVGAQARAAFNVGVSADRFVGAYSNLVAVAVPSFGKASAYPSAVEVTGAPGRIVKATVTLRGLQHGWPDDLDVLLVSPDGRAVILMSDAGGGPAVEGVDLKFSSSALVAPENGVSAFPGSSWRPGVCQGEYPSMDLVGLRSGSFLPVNYGLGDTFPTPAPTGPYGTGLDVLVGGQPNGTWNLYVFDDSPGNAGAMAGGWSIELLTSANEALLVTPSSPAGEPEVDSFLTKAWQTGEAEVERVSVEELPAGEAWLHLAGRSGVLYTIESSTNGVDWLYVAQGVVGSEEFAVLATDHLETGRPRYRVSAGGQHLSSRPGRVVEITHLADGTSCLVIEAASGRATILQGSSDLERWFDLQTFVHPGDRMELLDFSPQSPHRFYRLANP